MALEKFLVTGGAPLYGTVRVNGSKNAALPILCATILTRGTSVVHNVPRLQDVTSVLALLAQLGVRSRRRPDGALELSVDREDSVEAPYELVRKMRASIFVLGALLAKRGKARVSRPGGCNFGVRPIDLHEKGLCALGAEIRNDHGYVLAEAVRLRGRRVYLGGPYGSTVSGTANVMMAATLAEGTTIIDHAACEPEVEDLGRFLNACGARITGLGTPQIVIEGVPELHGAEHRVIPDRIEAGTFMIAAALTRGDVVVEGAPADHLSAVIDTLNGAGVAMEVGEDRIHVYRGGDVRPVDVTALPYPGFPTDLQSQMTTLLCFARGISVVTEKIYPDRFIHVAELNRLGARIRKEGNLVVINGVERFSGAPVMASDLRASACLVLAGLVAEGTTAVHRIYHIDRGYEKIEERLRLLGADIVRLPADAEEQLYELSQQATPELRNRLLQGLRARGYVDA
jgi:UDP-N-acetylglucosamine 1-carboxyvinyltransferase